MLIRCERCRALFSLQDGIARLSGASVRVECGRCLHVFEVAVVPSAPPPSRAEPRVAVEPSSPATDSATVAPGTGGPGRPPED